MRVENTLIKEDQHTLRLGNENIGRLLIRLSVPAVIGMMVNSLYNLVDTIFVGQGVGTLALASLAVCFPVQMFFLAIAQTVGIGAASIISRNLGAGNKRYAETVAGSSFGTIIVLSLILSVLGIIFIEPILRLFGASNQVLPYGKMYLQIIMFGGVPFSIAVSTGNLVRSEGNAKAAMTGMIIGAGTNIILDPVFIFGLNMGIRGAALATVIARCFSFIYLISYFIRGKSSLKFSLRELVPVPEIAKKTLKIGSASFTRIFASSIMAIAVNNTIMHFGTDTHLATLGVANRILLFTLMPVFGLVQGLRPIVGYNYGAEIYRRVRKSLRLAIYSATIFLTLVSVLILLFPQMILGIFSRDSELIQAGAPVLRILVVLLPLVGFQIVGASMFQAIGKARPAILLSITRQILFLIPLVLFLPHALGIDGVWLAFPGADLLAFLVTGVFFIREVRNMRTSL